jgi:pilus assembly protein Flp/PilA
MRMLFQTWTAVATWWNGLRLREQRGATAVEYALMLALIAAVIVGAVTLLGQNTSSSLGDFGTQFASAS